MGMRRGNWKSENYNKTASVRSDKKLRPLNKTAKPANVLVPGQSNSTTYIEGRSQRELSGSALKGVSDERKNEILTRGTAAQNENPSATPLVVYSNSFKKTQEIKKQFGVDKTASSSVGGTSFSTGGADVVRQAPEVYSPLFQMANLQLPRDRITMNAWNRNFYDTHPLVRNCINLHSTYPLGKLNIKCKVKKVEQFFSDMIEEMDLLGILHNVALEFYKIGEVFPYAELDGNKGIWKNILIQNPDYVHVKSSVLGGEPVISLRPDAALQRLVTSNNPADMQLRNQIDPEILMHVRKGNNIPLDNFHVSHLKMTSSPYDIHGTSIIVSIYKDLMLYDKLRECFDEETEILTAQGFKKFWEVIDTNGEKPKVKDGIKIAAPNPESDTVEFVVPTNTHLSDYTGSMYHFLGKKIDVKVTPNHRMWVSKCVKKDSKKIWNDWHFEKAGEISRAYWYKFKSKVNFEEGSKPEFIDVLGCKIPPELYMKILGDVVAEGCVYQNYKKGRYDNSVSICQNTSSPHKEKMRDSFIRFGELLNKTVFESIRVVGSGYSEKAPKEKWEARISGKDVVNYFKKEIGDDKGNCKSGDKRLPRWIFGLHSDLLNILLETLVEGDGRISDSLYGTNSKGYRYCTGSKQLADDVFELVYRLGFVPRLTTYQREDPKNPDKLPEYTVAWSTTKYGTEPLVYGNADHNGANINVVPYSGKVWCFEVPNGLLVTRRNGLISVQGNSKFAQADNLINPITLISVGGNNDGEYRASDADLEKWRQTFEAAQYDKDFKIISHAGVKVERIGASGSVIDISGDMSFIIDNILYGLMTPKAILTQEGASYSSASIGLEVLKQRYEAFRNMLAKWLTVKIFAPISEIHNFYEYRDGEKKLIVPEVDWNQMILFDMDNYVQVLQNLHNKDQQTGMRTVSKDTLFRSLGLDPEEERRRVRQEMIQEAIFVKEQQVIKDMSLSALRSIKPDEDVIEPTEEPLPGVPGADVGAAGAGGMGAPLDLGLPPMPGGGGGGFGGGGAIPDLGVPGGAIPGGEAVVTETAPPAAPAPGAIPA